MARKSAPTKAHKPEASPATPRDVRPASYSAFVASTDPKVTTCEAWKSLMQFRHELLTNPRQDSGETGWWSRWIGTMQRWLYGGGNWGEGNYAPSHRHTTPDCGVCLAEVQRTRRGMVSAGAGTDTIDPADDHRTMLFPANSTYWHDGFVIDWTKPFPPIAERGLIIEWVESWIDRIQYTEATGHYPWAPDAPATPTIDPAILARLEAAAAAIPAVLETNHAGFDRIAGVVESLGARNQDPKPPRKTKSTRQERRVTWLAQAMLTVRDHPEWSDATIASEVKINKSQLCRSREYRAAASMARTLKTPEGSVTITNGVRELEAVDDSFDPNRRMSRQSQDEEDTDDRIDREMRLTQRNTQRGAVKTPANRRFGGA